MTRVAPEPSQERVDEAVRTLRRWAKENPAHAKWIIDGAPPIHNRDDHLRVFGRSYDGGGAKKKHR